MRKIRRGMFETNSSSAHSIVIANGKCTDNIRPDTDGVVHIQAGEFGWGVERHYDAQSKASYCLTNAKYLDNAARLEMLRKVIQDHTGAKSVSFEPWIPGDKWQEWGYIDHQSIDDRDVGAVAFRSEESLRQFIFHSASELEISNDNL